MKTVLFDLDGTLLPMDQDVFIKTYLGALAKKLVPHGYDPEQVVKAIWAGTGAMVKNDGSRTNEDVFWDAFSCFFERDVRADEQLFTEFYRNEFQQVRHVCGFSGEAGELISRLKAKGHRLVLATNPLFPAIATRSRMRWAGLEPEDFLLYTTYENSRFCKPNREYYREILRKLGCHGEDCIMVGNDVAEDMIARELGMDVFLLTDCLINKDGSDISRYSHGGFPELMEFLGV